MPNPTDTALAITAVGQSMVAYQFFLPQFTEIRRADDAAAKMDVHLGLAAATTVSLSVGLMLSSLTGSRMPMYATAMIGAIVIGAYEYAVMQPGG